MQSRGSVLIERPLDDVFAFIRETGNDRLWRSHLVSSRGRVRAPGDRVSQTYSYDGHSRTVELTVSELDPPHRLTYALTEPARARMSLTCRPEEGGTRVSAAVSANLSGPAALLESRVQTELEKLLRTDLGRLKATLESQ